LDAIQTDFRIGNDIGFITNPSDIFIEIEGHICNRISILDNCRCMGKNTKKDNGNGDHYHFPEACSIPCEE